MFKHDPGALVGNLSCPVLVITGTMDLQIKVSEGDKLAAAKKGAKLAVIKNMSHVLKETTETELRAQTKTVYIDPKLPLHPDLVGHLVQFLNSVQGFELRSP
jgi:fermentation-respiration switch protein FrsA (DUF1100 family)